MSVICALAAVLLVAVDPPFPPKEAAPPAAAVPNPAAGGPVRRAAGTPATVEQMRREQKSLLDELDSDSKRRRMGGMFVEADIAASAADAERRARVGLALAKTDGEKAEELLVLVASLIDLERYYLARSESGVNREEAYNSARFQRLAAQVRLTEAVGAGPGVLRKLRDDQRAAAAAATKLLVNGRDGGTTAGFQAAVESAARYGAFAADAAAPADRPAAHARNVASMKDWEQYARLRTDAGVGRQSDLRAATYWRAETELRELEASGKADPARVTALRQGVREAAKKYVDVESVRRVGGLFLETDVSAFGAFQARLLQAELALAAGAEERRAVLKRAVAAAADAEEYFEQRGKSGVSHREQTLRAALDRVEAEIQLLTAK